MEISSLMRFSLKEKKIITDPATASYGILRRDEQGRGFNPARQGLTHYMAC
jgi:hypothetical protein